MIEDLTILILAGGKGQRLMPITKTLPKPLIKINNKEILSYVIDGLNRFEYSKMIILTGYKYKLINNFLKKKYKNNNRISTQFTGVKSDILSRIKSSFNYLSQNILICYGDTLADINLNKLYRFYQKKKYKMIITTYPYKSSFGVILKNKSGKIISFKEKPELNFDINIGYMLLKKKNLKPILKFKTFEKFLSNVISKDNVYSYRHFGKHITINTLKELSDAKKFLRKNSL